MLKRKGIILIIVLMVVAVCFINAGRFLVYDDVIHKSDAIIVLSGDRGERVERAAELYQKGYAKYFVISGGIVYHDVTMAQLMKEHAIQLGIPEKAIIMEDRADSTYENAYFTKKVIKSYPIHSAIVISSNYHMKRVKMIFDREFKDTGLKLFYTGAKDQYFSKTRWWSNNKSIMITITEYIKMVGYALGKNY
ncbi:YdcF family protein [Bacillus xiapuensis]|uniref:YdcF family protein n=1 Tax=Bacillus xiapuensis TaxID=2014075 RepID=A0ABU6N8K7_9BACI|nr:YdcF family protein [Bacillus xiapuensis]